MGKYRNALEISTANNGVVAPADEKLMTTPTTPPPADELVSVTIKVPRSLRQHWQIESKRRGITVTQLVVDFLSNTLGTP
jgi:hypothetical protein